jgi:hypothetical protein
MPMPREGERPTREGEREKRRERETDVREGLQCMLIVHKDERDSEPVS